MELIREPDPRYIPLFESLVADIESARKMAGLLLKADSTGYIRNEIIEQLTHAEDYARRVVDAARAKQKRDEENFSPKYWKFDGDNIIPITKEEYRTEIQDGDDEDDDELGSGEPDGMYEAKIRREQEYVDKMIKDGTIPS